MRTTIRLATASVVMLAACADRPTSPILTGSISPAFGRATDDPSANWLFPLADAGLSLVSDHDSASGGYSVYANGVCGVGGRIFATPSSSNSGDAELGVGAPKGTKCGRRLTLTYADGFVEHPTYLVAHHIANSMYSIPIGGMAKSHFAINPSARCDALRWGTIATADSVIVTRIDASTWEVASQPYPNDRARCVKTGESFHLTIRLRVVSSRPLN
jgi:hypothetical protein